MDQIDTQFQKLKETYAAATLQRRPDGTAVVSIAGFPLPPGWNSAATTIHILVPVGYPHAKLDSFWTDGALRLANNGMPANTGVNNTVGTGTLWFSYHTNHWNPNLDTLLTYVNVIKQRLKEAK